jgi:ATP-dependent DNA helicase RecQ
MTENPEQRALEYLRISLDNPAARFRPGQWDAISKTVIDKSRLLLVQRTGWGKSIVYFIATRLLRDKGAGPTLLISPLLALMRNQIEAAERININAATINSSNRQDWDDVQTGFLRGEVDILLISPERLANDDFRDNILLPIAKGIGLFVVDEAHCISDWGHDFRPDYRRIVSILKLLPPNVPALATTATANDRVVNDITQQLGKRLEVIRGPLVRSSLHLENIRLIDQAERMAWLAVHLKTIPGSGIIYTLTIKDSQRVADWLRTQGIDAHAYWGGLDNEIRVDLEQKLLNNKIKVLVATTALGMGFDKPDLSFVIHFQRPASVVHYYQQVGRAGRAIDSAYGIMLSGGEDEDITNYFIETAFPPEAHAKEILNELNQETGGLSIPEIEGKVNISRKKIDKVLKLLVVEPKPPVVKRSAKYYATPVEYKPDNKKIEFLKSIRKDEQSRMREYLNSTECLMKFLQEELNDPYAEPCGRCAPCTGNPLLPESYSNSVVNDAVEFLKRLDQVIEVRKMWPGDALVDAYGWKGRIPDSLQMMEGRTLCLWGDPGWGELVKAGKQRDGRFSDDLVNGMVTMINERWKPDPYPWWVTCISSITHPDLVPDFARRVANKLNLPFIDSVEKVRDAEPQKSMQNSHRQAKNIAGAFMIKNELVKPAPVFLIDDLVDSRWTLTIVAALLRNSGSGPVFPVALSMTTPVE